MIYLITRQYYDHTVRRELIEDRSLRRILTLTTYERLFRKKVLHGGTYIFADLERLDREATEKAAIIWKNLADHPDVRLLNDPIRSMRRFELLRNLHERGVNSFNVYRLTDSFEPKQYPVFIRAEDDHKGSATSLLHTKEELTLAVEELTNRGESRDNKLVIEFCDVSGGSGLYHFYEAYRIGNAIIPCGLHFLPVWASKDVNDRLRNEEHRAASKAFIDGNPHAAPLMEIFEMARIQYGRVDYAVVDGRIQVFEINTNPIAPPAATLWSVLPAIDSQSQVRVRIELPKRIVVPTAGAIQARQEQRIRGLISAVRLLKYERQIYALGRPVKKAIQRLRRLSGRL